MLWSFDLHVFPEPLETFRDPIFLQPTGHASTVILLGIIFDMMLVPLAGYTGIGINKLYFPPLR
jgi:hypothetical protein